MVQDQFALTNGKGDKIAIFCFSIKKNLIKYLQYSINLFKFSVYAYKYISIIYIHHICMSVFYRHKYTCTILGTYQVLLNKDKYQITLHLEQY